MVSYYIYGRENGFINYNPDYSQEDLDRFFLKMTPYSKEGLDYEQGQDSEKQNFPEKVFFYEVASKANGRCAIFGRSSFVRANTTKVSGDRDTVFSFQYLFNGEDRQKINENPTDLYNFLPFPSNMDQVCRPRDPSMPLNAGNSQLDLSAFPSSVENKCVKEQYTTEELLNAFSLTGEKLSEFLYTFLQLNARERVYLLLPDNTKASSDMAFALICRVLRLLPPVMVSRTGFVTYVNRVESSSADYVPFEIRHMFLANTEENRFICQRTRSAFVFADGYGTGIRIPAEMQEIVECFKAAFLDGSSGQRLQDLWDYLNSHLKEDASIPISPVEYQALDQFCVNCRTLADPYGAAKLPAEEDMWNNVDLLRKMGKERAALWLPKLSEDATQFVKELIDRDLMGQRGQYDRLFAEYRDYPELDESIELYFSRKVIDSASLETFIKVLEPCQPLKIAVAENHSDELRMMMQSDRLPETFYNTVLEMYDTSMDMRGTIVDFFERKITDTNSYFQYQKRITNPEKSGNGHTEIWDAVEKQLFNNQQKQKLVIELAMQMIEECFVLTGSWKTPNTAMRSFWLDMDRLKALNDSILYDGDFYRDTSINLEGLFETWNEPENVYQLLKDSETQVKQLELPSPYQSLFENISENYLKTFTNEICDSCKNPEILQNWPFLLSDNSILQKVRDKYEKRVGSLENFDVMIRSSSVKEIVDYFKDEKNKPIILQAAESNMASAYVSEILKKLEDEVTGHAIKNTAKDQYGELCLLLLLVFSSCTKDICVYVLESAYGGIASLCEIARALFNPFERPSEFTVTKEMTERYKRDLTESFKYYFNTHQASRADKKEIKDYRDYLIKRIGLVESEVDSFVKRG